MLNFRITASFGLVPLLLFQGDLPLVDFRSKNSSIWLLVNEYHRDYPPDHFGLLNSNLIHGHTLSPLDKSVSDLVESTSTIIL